VRGGLGGGVEVGVRVRSGGERERGREHVGRVIAFVRYALNHKYPNELLRVYVRPGRPWAHTHTVCTLASRPGLVLFDRHARCTLRRRVSGGRVV
jgi:hypothetical protein